MSPSTLRAAFAARVRQFLPLGFGSHVRDALTTHQPPTTRQRKCRKTFVLTQCVQTCRRLGRGEKLELTRKGVQSTTTSTSAGFEGAPHPTRPGGRPPPPARPHVRVLAPPNHFPPPLVRLVFHSCAVHQQTPCALPVRACCVRCIAEGGGGSPVTLRRPRGGGLTGCEGRPPKPNPGPAAGSRP